MITVGHMPEFQPASGGHTLRQLHLFSLQSTDSLTPAADRDGTTTTSTMNRNQWLCKLLFVTSFLTCRPTLGSGTNHFKSDRCEYDIDLEKNSVRAVCDGESSHVQVYAKTATVNAANVDATERIKYSAHRPGGGGGGKSPQDWNGMEFPGQAPLLPASFLNASNVLKDIQQNLGVGAVAMANITAMLNRADATLRSDLEALGRLESQPAAFRESVAAAFRNQYNFMKMLILTQNAELTKLIHALDRLAGVARDSIQNTIDLYARTTSQLIQVNQTMLVMRRMFSSDIRRQKEKISDEIKSEKKIDECPRIISAIGTGEKLSVQWDNGVVMRDPTASQERLWVMTGGDTSDQLLQYDSELDLRYHLVSRQYSLPFYCEGTGHVVYRRSLYCHKAGTRTISKYNLKRGSTAAEIELPSAGIGNTFPYRFRLKSDIDLAVDEMGLWVVYTTKEAVGKMIISKLNPRTLSIEKTWMTSFPKQLVGNTFMICGVLYATNSHTDTPTFIRYIYDTNTQQETVYESAKISFPNAVDYNSTAQANSVMLDYNPYEKKLYSWSKTNIEMFPVYFKMPLDKN